MTILGSLSKMIFFAIVFQKWHFYVLFTKINYGLGYVFKMTAIYVSVTSLGYIYKNNVRVTNYFWRLSAKNEFCWLSVKNDITGLCVKIYLFKVCLQNKLTFKLRVLKMAFLSYLSETTLFVKDYFCSLKMTFVAHVSEITILS